MARSDAREAVQARIVEHLQRYGAEASRVVDTFADRHAMHPTDLQALVIIMAAERAGEAATPGVLRQALNLTSGAVTGAVDRLVAAGHVARVADLADRRQTRLVTGNSAWQVGAAFFGPLGERTGAIMAGYGVDDLVVVEGFLASLAQAMADHRRQLQERPAPADRPAASSG